MTPHRSHPPTLRGSLFFFWVVLIFVLSQQPGSGGNWAMPWWEILERKTAHVVEYAVLVLLATRYFRIIFPREKFFFVLSLAALFSLAYGATDELHQLFVYGRGAHLTDVGIDG